MMVSPSSLNFGEGEEVQRSEGCCVCVCDGLSAFAGWLLIFEPLQVVRIHILTYFGESLYGSEVLLRAVTHCE